MLLRIIEGNPLLQMGSRAEPNSPRKNKVSPQRHMGHQKESRILLRLGQSEELLPQLPCRRVTPLRTKIKHPQSPQHREELRGLSHLLAQLPRPGVGSVPLLGQP